jgi:hypothetical protein
VQPIKANVNIRKRILFIIRPTKRACFARQSIAEKPAIAAGESDQTINTRLYRLAFFEKKDGL